MGTPIQVLIAAALLLFAPTNARAPKHVPPCPGGGEWLGAAPPEGSGYYCGQQRDGVLEKNGWAVSFDEASGRKVEACQYKNGLRDGRCTHYDEAGRISHRGFYRAGVPVHFQFFWDVLRKTPADPLPDRRAEVEAVATAVGGDAKDVGALALFVLDRYDVPAEDIRSAERLCAPSLCVSAGRVDDRNLVAFQIAPPADDVQRDGAAFQALRAKDTADKAKEAAAAEALRVAEEKAARKRRATYEKAVKAYPAKVRAWSNAHLRCNDGTRSPSCTCGGSYQGCCSWHGGVDGCPRAYPEEPAAPE